MTPVIRNLVMLSGLLVSAGRGVAAQATPPSEMGLHQLFVAAGKLYFGTAIETNNFNDSAYLTIANNRNEFGMYVPENSQKWEEIQPTPQTFDFSGPDAVLALARRNGQQFRCHTLTWHSQLPTFVANGTWTRDTLAAVIVAHITNVMTHYRGLCYAWDVVNEALNDNGTFRNSVFFRTMGTDFIPLSFAAAARADPSARLYYNDFNLETAPRKAAAAVRIVQLVQAANIPIHGLGFQAHFRVGLTPNVTSLIATQNLFTSLGLEVAFSELDVAHLSLPPNASSIAGQSRDYLSVIQACLAVPKCVGITLWQFTDKYSWIPSTFPGLGDACLYTANFTKKPAYDAVKNYLVSVVSNMTTGAGRNVSIVTTVAPPAMPTPTGMMTLPADIAGELAPFVTSPPVRTSMASVMGGNVGLGAWMGVAVVMGAFLL